MQPINESRLEKKQRSAFVYLSISVAIIGFIVLLGWALDIAVLKSFSSGWVSMKANHGFCLLPAGVTLILLNKEKRLAELVITNKELAFQNDEKQKSADELIIAKKELIIQNQKKEKI